MPGPSAATTSAVGAVQTGFHTTGNQIIGPNGGQFIPTGFVLECLAMRDLSCMQHSNSNPNTDSDKIRAAATFWHANIVRLQVSQEQLFATSPYNAPYLAALEDEIHLANSLGMVASITLQEELYSGPPFPTASSVRFWEFMAHQLGNRTGVFFDLYNEPRLRPLQGEDWLWNIWQNGGQVTVDGVSYSFVGMQTLVDTIRRAGATNLIVAEGNGGDHEVTLLSTHLLRGVDVSYAVEPNITRSRSSPSHWDALYGSVSDRVPLVMDAFQDYPTGHCYDQSPSVLPQLFSYLRSKHLGLLVWTLEPGNLIVGNNLEQPTSYQGATTQLCVAHRKNHRAARGIDYQATTNTNGPGQDILGFFRDTSHQLPATELLGVTGSHLPNVGSVQGSSGVVSSGSGTRSVLIVGLFASLGAALLTIVVLARMKRRRNRT